jgi:hypothetical protein
MSGKIILEMGRYKEFIVIEIENFYLMQVKQYLVQALIQVKHLPTGDNRRTVVQSVASWCILEI